MEERSVKEYKGIHDTPSSQEMHEEHEIHKGHAMPGRPRLVNPMRQTRAGMRAIRLKASKRDS